MLTGSIGPAGTRATQDAQERPDPDPARREPVGQGEEGRGAGGRLVGEEGGVRQAGPIIDGDVQVLRAAAPAPASVVPVNGGPTRRKRPSFLMSSVPFLAGATTIAPALAKMLRGGRSYKRIAMRSGK
jgi:hypothetical protein